MIPRADYQAIGDLRAKIEVLADRLGFELSSFILEEYPGSEWEEPVEIKISIKQRYERTEDEL